MWPDLVPQIQKLKSIAKSCVRDPLRSLFWVFYGHTYRNPPLERIPQSILFVCTGNICRSPFAEKVATRIDGEEHGQRFVFASAGIHVETSLPPPENAILIGREFGVDLVDNRSRPISEELVDRHDMVIGMEALHIRALRDRFPDYRWKFHLLPLFDRSLDGRSRYRLYNIEDPYGYLPERYRECFLQIERCLQGLFQVISVSDITQNRIRRR